MYVALKTCKLDRWRKEDHAAEPKIPMHCPSSKCGAGCCARAGFHPACLCLIRISCIGNEEGEGANTCSSRIQAYITRSSRIQAYITCSSRIQAYITCSSRIQAYITWITCSSRIQAYITCSSRIQAYITCSSRI
jgi:hypothetical protein